MKHVHSAFASVSSSKTSASVFSCKASASVSETADNISASSPVAENILASFSVVFALPRNSSASAMSASSTQTVTSPTLKASSETSSSLKTSATSSFFKTPPKGSSVFRPESLLTTMICIWTLSCYVTFQSTTVTGSTFSPTLRRQMTRPSTLVASPW